MISARAHKTKVLYSMTNLKATFIGIVSIFLCIHLSAQWECPSKIGASLRQIKSSNWAIGNEFAFGAGYLTDNLIFNSMMLAGLDYTGKNHTFYAEGGYKYWNRKDFSYSSLSANPSWGMRELYYKYSGNKQKLTVGLQSMRPAGNYLLNERVLGFLYKYDSGPISISAYGGTVTNEFARNGKFCAVGYLYDIMPYYNHPVIGNHIGETNLAGIKAEIFPAKLKKQQTTQDEFSLMDVEIEEVADTIENSATADTLSEFDSVDEFVDFEIASSQIKKRPFILSSAGFMLYTEFGDLIQQKNYYPGIFFKTSFFESIWLDAEVIYQQVEDNRLSLFSFRAGKHFDWQNGTRTSVEAIGYCIIHNDLDAELCNSFSNIFAGLIMRMDVHDLPLYILALKHRFTNQKIHVKMQFCYQTKDIGGKECDLELGKKFGKHLWANTLFGFVDSPVLDKPACLARLEMRISL